MEKLIKESAREEIRKAQKAVDNPNESIVAKAHAIGTQSILYRLLLLMAKESK